MEQQDLRVIKSRELAGSSEPKKYKQLIPWIHVDTEERKGQHQTREVIQIKVTDTMTPENEEKRNVNSKRDNITT